MTVAAASSPESLEALAHEWVKRVDEIGFPTRSLEAWRYAPLADLQQLSFEPPAQATALESDQLDALVPAFDAVRLVIVNGHLDHSLSQLEANIKGLNVAGLSSTCADEPDSVAPHFDHGWDGPVDLFMALNRAFGRDGVIVRVDQDHHIDKPIHIIDVTTPTAEHQGHNSGVVIELGPRAAATVVETRVGVTGHSGATNIRTSVILHPGAKLEHTVIQNLPPNQVHLGRIEVRQSQHSAYTSRAFNLGARYGRMSYDIHLQGEAAQADLSGLYFGTDRQNLDQQINMIHDSRHTTSSQVFRGVLDEQSTGVFSGGIDVRRGADGTEAHQKNDNLLLSRQAEVNTQPRLEILADEVVCQHGATVGQLDETALYYLRSRGIPANDARRLLVDGFADEMVDSVGPEELRTWIIKALGHKDA